MADYSEEKSIATKSQSRKQSKQHTNQGDPLPNTRQSLLSVQMSELLMSSSSNPDYGSSLGAETFRTVTAGGSRRVSHFNPLSKLPPIDDQSDLGTYINTSTSLLTNGMRENNIPLVEAVNLAVVYEDFADALDVLGRSIDGPEIELRTKPSIALDEKFHRPKYDPLPKKHVDRQAPGKNTGQTVKAPAKSAVKRASEYSKAQSRRSKRGSNTNNSELPSGQRYLLKQQYESVLPRRIRQGCDGPSTSLTKRLSFAIKECYLSTVTQCGKNQVDRAFIQKTVQDVMVEMIQKSSFSGLIDAIQVQYDQEDAEAALIQRNKELDARRRYLARELKKCNSEKANEIKRYDRLIWKYEDHAQEVRNRTGSSQAYCINVANMVKRKSFYKCKAEATGWTNKLKDMKISHNVEDIASLSIREFLQKEINRLQDRCDEWMEKYTAEKEQLQSDLDILKINRERDRLHKEWLLFQFKQYWEIVKDERRQQKNADDLVKRFEFESMNATKLSAWWRGTMVRRQLGPFGKMFQSLRNS